MSQQRCGSMSLTSHHAVATAAAEEGQQLQARAVVQGILYPGCWPRAHWCLGSVTARTPNTAPPRHAAQRPGPIPGGMSCCLGSERPLSGLTEIKPRACTPKVAVLSPGPALADLPPAQEALHAAATAPVLLRVICGGAEAGHCSAHPGASAGVGTAGSWGRTPLGSASACLFSGADAACQL